MVATAAVATVSAAKIVGVGHPAQLERLAHVLLNRFLHVVQFFLGIEETASDRVGQKTVPGFFEIDDFIVRQRRGGLLLLLQSLAFFDQPLERFQRIHYQL